MSHIRFARLAVFSSLSVLALVAVASATPPPPPIVGGTLAPPGKWPDTVAVLGKDGACSGTLVAPDVVVTAGHCIDTEPETVVVDSTDYARTGGERIPVAWSRAYPEWYRSYDIGVVVLARPSRVPPRTVTSACTVRAHVARGTAVQLVGFGVIRQDGGGANSRLHEAAVTITDPSCTTDPSCQEAVAPHGELVAGGRGVDACFGDSGGPMFLASSAGPVLLGVVSRGLMLAQTPCGGGGVFVRIDKVTSWIQRVTGRQLSRTTCEGKGEDPDATDAIDDASSDGGCSATGGGAPALTIVVGLLGFVARRRRGGRGR
jgi:uncharacterized protein (TIGR03382 family)